MKLNFWQILGIIVIVVAVAFLVYRKTGTMPATPIEPVAPPPTMPPPDAKPMTGTPIPTH